MPRKPTEKQTPEERAEKNRRNASRSCGPKTACGKAASARNSYKHGVCARTTLASVDEATTLDELNQQWFDAYQPRTPGQVAALKRSLR